jgi:hypothetical protein
MTEYPRNPENTRPKKNAVKPRACGRCGGRGYGPWLPDGGRCYQCLGSGRGRGVKVYAFPVDWTDAQCAAWTEDYDAKLAARREARKKAKEEAAESARLEVVEKNLKAAGVRALNFKTENTFILDIQAKAQKYLLSQKQVDALKKACQRERDRKKEAKHDIMPPDGRQSITGEVIAIKPHEGEFGFSMKLTVKCDGYRLWGTLPKGLSNIGLERGDTVTFTATIKPKEKGFGFFSRPHGGEVL